MDETKKGSLIDQRVTTFWQVVIAVGCFAVLLIITMQNPSYGVIVVCPNCSFSGEFVWGNPASPNWGSMDFTVVCVNCKRKIAFTVYDNGTVVVH